MGLEVICRLRPDANLKNIYNGYQKEGRSRAKKHAGKVELNKIDMDQSKSHIRMKKKSNMKP